MAFSVRRSMSKRVMHLMVPEKRDYLKDDRWAFPGRFLGVLIDRWPRDVRSKAVPVADERRRQRPTRIPHRPSTGRSVQIGAKPAPPAGGEHS